MPWTFQFRRALAVCFCASTAAADVNFWPLWVERQGAPPDEGLHRQAVGPFVFDRPYGADRRAFGVRPFFVGFDHLDGERQERYILYPLVTHRRAPSGYRTSFFQLINREVRFPETPSAVSRFEVFPFYFSHQTDDPATSYRGLLPIYGGVRNRFGTDRIDWVAFPLYLRYENRGTVTTAVPWPFIRHIGGDDSSGFEFWPLIGFRTKADVYERRFLVWPFVMHSRSKLWLDKPDERLYVLPFYTRETSANRVSENFLWPFFGYTRRTDPDYREVRWFWPLAVTGRGQDRTINRWLPIYADYETGGLRRTWFIWPLMRRQTWDQADLRHEETRLLFFLYSNLEQYRPGAPGGPRAQRTHFWPLVSVWDNGAGRRQAQILSPFESFFPHNDPIRAGYSPLFALYRYDRKEGESTRHSLLWDLVRWGSTPEKAEFQFGPLVRVASGDESHTFSLLNGLMHRRRDGENVEWSFFWNQESPGSTDLPPAPEPRP